MTNGLAQTETEIMCRDDAVSIQLKRKQANMFRLAKRDYDLDQIDVSEETGLHKNSIGNYARGESIMGIAVFFKLCFVLPARLLSMMLPRGFFIVRVPEEMDYDTFAAAVDAAVSQLIEGE